MLAAGERTASVAIGKKCAVEEECDAGMRTSLAKEPPHILTDCAWVGYANGAIRSLMEPPLRRALEAANDL